MSDIEERLADYRQLRNASKKAVMADIKHARTSFSAKGLTNRYLGGVIEGGKDVFEVAKGHTVDNRGVIALVLGALALWFGREPLLAAMAEEIEDETGDTDDTGETEDAEAPAKDPPEEPAVQPSETDLLSQNAS